MIRATHTSEREDKNVISTQEHCIALKCQSLEHYISNESENSDKGTSAVFTTDYELGNVKGTELFAVDVKTLYVRIDDVRLNMKVDTGAAV